MHSEEVLKQSVNDLEGKVVRQAVQEAMWETDFTSITICWCRPLVSVRPSNSFMSVLTCVYVFFDGPLLAM